MCLLFTLSLFYRFLFTLFLHLIPLHILMNACLDQSLFNPLLLIHVLFVLNNLLTAFIHVSLLFQLILFQLSSFMLFLLLLKVLFLIGSILLPCVKITYVSIKGSGFLRDLWSTCDFSQFFHVMHSFQIFNPLLLLKVSVCVQVSWCRGILKQLF